MELTEDEFCYLCEAFIKESDWDLRYSEDHARLTYQTYAQSDECKFIVIRQNQIVVAAAICALDYFAHDRPFGYIVKFYVLPSCRDRKISAKLIELCSEWFDEKNTIADFATPHAKIGNCKAAKALLKLSGYKKQIETFYRESQHGKI